MTAGTVQYAEAIRDALAEEMDRDARVLLIGEDLRDPSGGAFKATAGLSTRFGAERVLNTPIAEDTIVDIALGAALTGLRPVVELMFFDFVMRGMDAVANQVAKARYMSGGQFATPMVIRTPGGGGASSGAQHGNSLEAWICHVPGLLVAMPSTPHDAKGLLKSAIRMDDPVFFIEHKLLYQTSGPVPDGDHLVPFGVADVKLAGSDVTIVATSRMVHFALTAAERLESIGVSAEVIDPRTLVPLDTVTILESVRKTNRLVVVHEAVERCGWGAELCALVQKEAFGYLEAPIERVCGLNTPLPFQPDLERFVLPSVEDIVRAAIVTLGRETVAG
jgi:acetoin:2,6-dichlorophenolindophenol oxidoreductase subunit beta